MDSRTCSILINLDIDVNSKLVSNKYASSVSGIKNATRPNIKSYSTLRSALQESYLTGSLKYGNNFIM